MKHPLTSCKNLACLSLQTWGIMYCWSKKLKGMGLNRIWELADGATNHYRQTIISWSAQNAGKILLTIMLKARTNLKEWSK